MFYGRPFLSHLLLAWSDIGIRFSVRQSVNICINPNFDPNVQVHFPRTIEATVMRLCISLHFGMTTQTAVSTFVLDLYFTVHQLYKCESTFLPCRRDIAFGRILVRMGLVYRDAIIKSQKLFALYKNVGKCAKCI